MTTSKDSFGTLVAYFVVRRKIGTGLIVTAHAGFVTKRQDNLVLRQIRVSRHLCDTSIRTKLLGYGEGGSLFFVGLMPPGPAIVYRIYCSSESLVQCCNLARGNGSYFFVLSKFLEPI
jgi:hypothetical protein